MYTNLRIYTSDIKNIHVTFSEIVMIVMSSAWCFAFLNSPQDESKAQKCLVVSEGTRMEDLLIKQGCKPL